MDVNELRIHSYLRLGYFIDYPTREPMIDFSVLNREPYRGVAYQELVTEGVRRLRDTFASQFNPHDTHVLPLSGGLDSRFILGALLELTEAKNINTVTFGVPGTYDYDIGCLVAKTMGTRHCALALDGFTYLEDELLDRARRMHRQVIVFYCTSLWHLDRLFGDAVIWSGYVNDAVAGSHLSPQPAPTLIEAKRRYLSKRRLIRSTQLDHCPDEEYFPYIAGGGIAPEVLSFDEQVLFEEAVYKFTAPIVLLDGFRYKTPFINSPWMEFMFGVPNEWRLNQRLMIDVGRSAFPKLMELPTRTAYGFRLGVRNEAMLAARVVNRARKALRQFVPSIGYPPMLYNDFDERFRDSPDWIELARRNLTDLERRGIVEWIDVQGIWKRHASRFGNFGDAIAALVSLELVYKVAENK